MDGGGTWEQINKNVKMCKSTEICTDKTGTGEASEHWVTDIFQVDTMSGCH